MTDDFQSIREMCEEFGVTARALRFYETKELLSPLRRGQRRLYTRRDRARLKLILRGKRFGFTLEEIRQLLDLYDGAGGQTEQIVRACALAERHLHDLEARRVELDAVIAELRGQIAWGRSVVTAQHQNAAAE